MSEEQDILQELGIEEINEDTQNYYSIMVYGKSGTGKTTLATRENNAFIIDIHEDGTQVTRQGFVIYWKIRRKFTRQRRNTIYCSFRKKCCFNTDI
nr:AAA family ATPase [Staphylococcus aureus]